MKVMEQKHMDKKLNKTAVFLLPLIDKSFTMEYLLIDTSKKKDPYQYTFVNAYIVDNNSPGREDRIRLVYRTIGNNKRFTALLGYLKVHPLFDCTYMLFIKGEWYTVICMKIPDTLSMKLSMTSIKSSMYSWLSYNEKVRIMMFWNSSVNSKLHAYLFDSDYKVDKYDDSGIPKETKTVEQRRLQGLIPKEPFSFIYNILK